MPQLAEDSAVAMKDGRFWKDPEDRAVAGVEAVGRTSGVYSPKEKSPLSSPVLNLHGIDLQRAACDVPTTSDVPSSPSTNAYGSRFNFTVNEKTYENQQSYRGSTSSYQSQGIASFCIRSASYSVYDWRRFSYVGNVICV